MSTEAPATYKQPSRKGKKAWRKNVDVRDIDEGLEELRKEVISGGVVAEKTNDQLFTLDVVGDRGVQRKVQAQYKILKVDEILNARSAVPVVSAKKRENSMVTDGIVPVKKQRKDWVSHKDLQRIKKIAYGAGEAAVAKKSSNGEQLFDPWAETPEPDDRERVYEKLTFLEKPKPLTKPTTLNLSPVSLLASGKQLPAVKLPDAGISYNPNFKDWDELKNREGEKEVLAEKKRLAEAETEAERLRKLAIEDARERAKELLEASKDDDGEDEDEEEQEDDNDTKETFVKKRTERKTRAQRNRERRWKEEEKRLKMLQLQRRQKQQLEMVKHIKKAIEAKENARLEALAKQADADGKPEEAEKYRRRKFGKHHLPQAPLELQLEDELADSLRRLKPEGNLLKDRFRSLMERGIVETRVMPVIAKKRKVKEVEKWSYKDFK